LNAALGSKNQIEAIDAGMELGFRRRMLLAAQEIFNGKGETGTYFSSLTDEQKEVARKVAALPNFEKLKNNKMRFADPNSLRSLFMNGNKAAVLRQIAEEIKEDYLPSEYDKALDDWGLKDRNDRAQVKVLLKKPSSSANPSGITVPPTQAKPPTPTQPILQAEPPITPQRAPMQAIEKKNVDSLASLDETNDATLRQFTSDAEEAGHLNGHQAQIITYLQAAHARIENAINNLLDRASSEDLTAEIQNLRESLQQAEKVARQQLNSATRQASNSHTTTSVTHGSSKEGSQPANDTSDLSKITDSSHSIFPNTEYVVNLSPSAPVRNVTFSRETADYLQERGSETKRRIFLKAIQRGFVGDTGQAGVKRLGVDNLVEVKIMGIGNSDRLIGCYEDGTLQIMRVVKKRNTQKVNAENYRYLCK
jgi:hypothetical protein